MLRPSRLLSAALLCGLLAAASAAHATGLVWSTFLGGNGSDCGYAIATDSNGDIYVAGSTSSTNYPVTSGAFQRALKGANDVVVTKLRSDGATVIWSTYLGGTADDVARGIAVDRSGNVYVTGYTYSTDFPVSSGSFQPASAGGGSDAFVAKLNASGSGLAYATYLGGSGQEAGYGINVNGNGEAMVGGITGSANFPTTRGVVKPSHFVSFNDASDGFITKLNATGSGLIFSTYVGTDGSTDYLYALAVDGSGQPVVVGSTFSLSFPTTTGAYQRSSRGKLEGYVTKLNATGTGYVFSTYLGGSGDEYIYAVALDGNANVYVGGMTASYDFPLASPVQSTNKGVGDAFLTKLNAAGSALAYSTYLGGTSYDDIRSIVVNSNGNAIAVGTGSSGYPTTPGAVRTSPAGGYDVVATALSATGSTLAYSTFLGASGTDMGYAVTLRSSGVVALSGSTDNGAFPTTSGAFDVSQNSAGTADGFATVLDMGLSSSGAGVGDTTSPAVQLSAGPNPCITSTTVSFSLPTTAAVSLRILDVQGRLVRVLEEGTLASGPHRIAWDGRDDSGNDAGPGVYLLSLEGSGLRSATRLTRLR